MRRWLRRAIWIVVALVALPHALLLVYRVVPPLVTPLMVARLVDGTGLYKDWVSIDEISPSLAEAVVAAEDNRFCVHRGVDWTEMQAAVGDYWADDRVRGASTITMQTVKNVVLWPGRNMVRKAIEIYLAHYVELIWPKRRILEVYLNVAEWGPGVYGAEAAAMRYFGKPARQLSRAESALLAATLPNPRRWRPDRPTAYISDRAASIRRRIEQLGPLLDCTRTAARKQSGMLTESRSAEEASLSGVLEQAPPGTGERRTVARRLRLDLQRPEHAQRDACPERWRMPDHDRLPGPQLRTDLTQPR